MASHIEKLSDELLLLILQHLPTSSLVYAVTDVSLRFRRLSLDAHLWRGRIVTEHWSSDASALRFFSRGPSVHSLAFQRCVAQQCRSLTMLSPHDDQRMELRTLRAVSTGLPHLRHLAVGVHVLTCPLRARVVATLMPSLETLTIIGLEGEPRLRELAGGCPSLRRLNVFSSTPARLSDLGPEVLGRLRGLSLHWESLTRDVVLCVASLQELTLGYYDEASLPDAALAEDLRTLTALSRVDAKFLRGSRVLLEALLQPTLRALTLSYSPTVDDALLLLACRRCPLLEDFDISFCDAITDRGLSQLWRLRGLRRLRLAGCKGLGGGATEHLARCQGLQELNIYGLDLRSLEPSVPRLLELRKMRFLTVSASSARDMIPWQELPKAFPGLRVLELGEWMSLYTPFLETLKAALPKFLVRWYISWCEEEESDEDEHEERDFRES